MKHADIRKICALVVSVYNQDRHEDDHISWSDVSISIQPSEDGPVAVTVFVDDEIETAQHEVLDDAIDRLTKKLKRRLDA